jgi:ADP-ribose pyrophosphatase YjhB (NUDIX family)
VTDPAWLLWAREMQAIAQSGLTFSRDPYDRERYEQLRGLAARIMVAHSGADLSHVEALFAGQQGYATPKIDVRGAAFNDRGEILMVREVQDGGRWTLPGGWADVNLTMTENVIKEVAEESGFRVRPSKVAAVWDRSRQGHSPPIPFSTCKLFFVCDITGGAANTSLETSEIAFFSEDRLPDDLSLGRVLPHQLRRMFAHCHRPELPTDFD